MQSIGVLNPIFPAFRSEEQILRTCSSLATFGNKPEDISKNRFEFPGVLDDVFDRIRANEEKELIDYGFNFGEPISDVLGKMRSEGVYIYLGDNPESGTVFVVPTSIVVDGKVSSTDLQNWSLPVASLNEQDVTNPELKELILLDREIKEKRD